MDRIYEKIWKLAKPYYKKGREMDLEHVEWMMEEALSVCEKERIDDSLLLPLVILHDVGYAGLEGNPFKADMRKAHMKAGANIAREILEEVDYDSEKIEKITHYISVHDNWSLGDDKVYKDKILGVLTDLDFIWMATPKGFPSLRKILGKDKEEMTDWLKNNEKLKNRPFCTKTTKNLFKKYLKKLTSKQPVLFLAF